MGAVNYWTSEIVTVGLKPLLMSDFDEADYIELAEECDCEVNYLISQEIDEQTEWFQKSITNLLKRYENDLWMFGIKIRPGYYEGFSIYIDTDDFPLQWEQEEKDEATKQADLLEEFLLKCIDEGLVVCHPGWCTGYEDEEESRKSVHEGIEKLKQDIADGEYYTEDGTY